MLTGQRTAHSAQRIMTEYAAIIPMVIIALSAVAAMLAEAFRQPGERMAIAGLGLIGLAGAATASVFLWNSDARSFGVIRSDNFALFINLILCVIGADNRSCESHDGRPVAQHELFKRLQVAENRPEYQYFVGRFRPCHHCYRDILRGKS